MNMYCTHMFIYNICLHQLFTLNVKLQLSQYFSPALNSKFFSHLNLTSITVTEIQIMNKVQNRQQGIQSFSCQLTQNKSLLHAGPRLFVFVIYMKADAFETNENIESIFFMKTPTENVNSKSNYLTIVSVECWDSQWCLQD